MVFKEVLMRSNVEGQRREPATGGVGIATRHAGWRTFTGTNGSPSLISTRRGTRCSRLPMRHVINLFSTGWQDGQDGLRVPRGYVVILSSCYPV
jgi:hypothetical protein